MKAIGIWQNEAYNEELESIKSMGLSKEPTEPKTVEGTEVYFDIEKVCFFNKNDDGNIRLNLMHDIDLVVKYSDKVWSALTFRYGNE